MERTRYMWPKASPSNSPNSAVQCLRDALACVIVSASLPLALVHAQGAPTVEILPDPSGQGGRVKARIVIPAPPRIVWHVMVDCANAPRYVPGLRRCTVESTTPNGQSDIRLHRISWLAGLPQLTIRFVSFYQQEREIRFERISGDVARMSGIWTFRPLDNGRATELSYDASLAPSPMLPSALVRSGLRRDTPKILEAVRAESIRQRDAGQ
jgi:ribosome-associated toxin RatA of RatAB toxin-antitoxin module